MENRRKSQNGNEVSAPTCFTEKEIAEIARKQALPGGDKYVLYPLTEEQKEKMRFVPAQSSAD